MPEQTDNTPPLPYADVAGSLLDVIYDSLHIIYSARFQNLPEEAMVKGLVDSANRLKNEKWAKAQSRNNEHVKRGIRRSENSDEHGNSIDLRVPRISKLCLEASEHTHNLAHDSSDEKAKGIFVPSPLAILVDALTLPSRPESSAYGFALARAMLFSHFKIHPPTLHLPNGWAELPILDVQDIIESFRIYAKHSDNIHHSKRTTARVFLAHFLAMNGTFVLRFGTVGKQQILKMDEAQAHCLDFLKRKRFLSGEPDLQVQYEFRLAPGLMDMPDTQELLNSLIGVPVPLAGGATVFFGGLQRSHHNSVVMSVSGPAGTGKTSFALALAASLAPFGTQCLYCTFEEDDETLNRRALGLVPQYFRRTTLPNSDGTGWLHPINLEPTAVKGVQGFASEFLPALTERLGAAVRSTSKSATLLPGVAPLLVVIDSLTPIFGNSETATLDDFCNFVRHLRELNCIVLLLSAEDIPQSSRLEYLVDTVINLRHEDTNSPGKKPFRLFQLIKTRLQMSRPGSHILHLSGERGLRISPQLPSQLLSHEIHKSPLPDRSGVIDTLRVEGKNGRDARQLALLNTGPPERLSNLFPRSKILIHGHGSSGKAALALKILMSRPVGAKSGEPIPLPAYKRPRILVISFLYPQEYYEKTFHDIWPATSHASKSDARPEMFVLALPPGFIGSEDFIARVLLEMDRGHLEGWPYTGVLLDGLHNTFLQFPSLQGSPMVWTALYSLLSRYELTIVSTFTTFSKSHPARSGHNQDDEELILQGQLPFLHVVVQATDFYLQVEPRDPKHHDRTFHITVESALGQRIPSLALVWNADDCTFVRFENLTSSPPSPQLRLPLK